MIGTRTHRCAAHRGRESAVSLKLHRRRFQKKNCFTLTAGDKKLLLERRALLKRCMVSSRSASAVDLIAMELPSAMEKGVGSARNFLSSL